MDEKELERLYNAVNSKFDIGDYNTFRTRMQTPEDRKKFYDVVGSKGFDLGQYPFYEERLSGVKKKQSSDVGSTPLGSGVSNNQDIENEPVPAQVGEYQQGEPDVFELTKQYNDFSKAEKVNYRYEPQTGATVSDVTPDQEKRDQAKGIKQSLMDLGIENPETFYNEIKDLTPTEFGTKGFSKQELIADRKENYNHYLRKIGTIKWRRGLESELADRLTYNLNEGGITKEAYDNISGSIQSSLKSLRENVGDYRQQRDNARNISFQIKQFGGQKKDELLANYAADISKLYGNAYKKGFEKYAASAPESKYLDNNALLAYEYLQDVSPEKAKQYELLLRDPKTLKDDPDALSAYNRLMLNLKETGIGLQKNAINEDLNSLVKVSKENDGLTPEQLQEVEKLQERLHTIETFENTLDSEYPERIEDEVDDAVQEIMGQKTGYASYVPLKAKNAVKNTVKGVWEMVSEPFLSDESNQMRELSIMGESVQDEKDTHKVDKNVSLQTSKMVFDPELKSKLDTINDDNSLTYGEKEDKIQSLLRSNRDKFGRVEIAGGKMNVSPASIAYGVTDLATTLLPFFAVEAATGGIGGAGTAAKFFRTANAALLTGFHDHYAESLNKGLRGSNAYFHAMGMTSIDAAIMAGAGTVEAVKAFYKGKNLSSSKVIEKLSDKEIQAGIDRGLSKGLKSVKQSIVDRAKATPGMIAKGAKTGAEFEVAMAAGEQLKGALNNERIDPKEQTKRAVLGIINFAGMASVLGHAGYKSPNDLQRSYMVDIGKQPDGYKAALEKMRKDGDINKEAYEEKLSIIDRATEAYKTLPKYNSKGKPITEAQKGDYIMQTVAKNEHDANKKNLPPKQAADAELKSKTADYVRQMILDEPTDKQLETQLSKVEKLLEPKKDADGKIEEMPENERLELKAEKDAIEFIINERKEKGEPPKGEAVSSGIYSEPKRTEFSHRGLQEVATEFGLDPVTSRERKSDAELFRRVDETLSEWTKSGEYNKKIEELLQRDRVKKPISDEENVIIAQHIAQLRKQAGDIRKEAGINSPEYNEKLKELNEVVRVGEAIRSEQGAALRVPIFSREYMPTLEDAMTAKMDAVGTDVLTPKQKVEVEKQFEKIEKERDEYKAKLEAANAKFAEMQAQSELSKPASKGKTTTGKRDYKAERQSLKDRLKEEVAAYKAAGQKMGIASDGGAESFVVSSKIAKTITEIARTHVAETGAKIKEVVERTLEDVKEYFGDNISDRDIMDVLAGKYNEKRKTRSQLAADMREVQTEAKLLQQYESLLKKEPQSEKAKVEQNKRLKELRDKIKELQKEQGVGQYSEAEKAKRAIERNKKREQEVREKITNKDFDEKKKPVTFWEEPSFKKNHPDLYKQVLDSYNKKEEAQLDYELELLKDAEGKKTKTQKVLDWLGRGANTTKKVVTGIDDSSLFMQTLAAMTARPFVAWQAIRLHALDAVSKKRFDRNLAELHNSPDWDLMKKSGLDVTEPKSLSATAHEEAFSGKSWDITFKKGGKEYKVLQTMLSPFERAFTSLGNGMRVIAFRSLAEKFEREGHTFENNPQLYKDLATMLNTETGRGKQNEHIERASKFVTLGIWSPQLMASRLNMLGISDAISFIPGMDKGGTKGYYRQLTPEIRKQALKDLAKFSATVMAVSALVAYAVGGEVDNDPDSVTFLDIKTPDGKSYNISGGFAQYIKLVAQTISGGKRKNGILEEFKGEKSEGSNIMRFGRGKLTPLAGVITDFATGKDFMGKEVEPLEEAKKLAIPLSLQSVATEIKRDGLSSLFTATLPSFVGIQVKDDRDFEKKGDKKQGMPQKKQKPTKEKKFAP